MLPSVRPITALPLVCLLCAACGSSPVEPSAGATSVRTASVEGVVNHEAYVQGFRLQVPAGPLAGAEVVVTEGPGAGKTFTTGTDGAYHFDLPPGPFRLRWSGEAWEPRNSDAGTVAAGESRKLATVTLRLISNIPVEEWVVSGQVFGGQGNPVAGAGVNVFGGGLTQLGSAGTDAAGRFRAPSRRQHPDQLSVVVEKSGYVVTRVPVTCLAACAVELTVRLLRIVREYLEGPSTMQVGDVIAPAMIREFDDGSRDVLGRLLSVESSNPSVLQVQPDVAPFEHVYVKALSPGAATLTFAGLSLPIRVYP